MTSILIDFTLEAIVVSRSFACSRRRWHDAKQMTDGEIAGLTMTRAGSDDHATTADRRWSALMAAAQSGDGIAYQTLLRGCIPVIKAIARRRGIEAARIDDVVQDVLLTIHRARQTFDPSRSFTAWLSVIADRRAIDLIRRIRLQGQREVYSPFAFERHADEAADPSREIALGDRRSAIELAVETLP